MAKTVMGLYSTFEVARQVVRALQDNGIQRSGISLIAADKDGAYEQFAQSLDLRPMDTFQSEAPEMGDGQPLGALAEMLYGLTLMDVIGLGKAVVAGPLVDAFASKDANHKGLSGVLAGIGAPSKDAQDYTSAVRAGAVLIAVYAVEGVAEDVVKDAVKIMNRFSPINTRSRDRAGSMEDFATEDLDVDHVLQPSPRASAHMGGRGVATDATNASGYVTEDLDQDHTLGRPVRPTGEQERMG